jgi:hypothetical protein
MRCGIFVLQVCVDGMVCKSLRSEFVQYGIMNSAKELLEWRTATR